MGGWPDSGDGRFSQKLPYKDWMHFNNSMRVHQNFVEQLPIMLTFLLIGGLVLPKMSAIVGVLVVVSRALYSLSYVKLGPNWRPVGALANIALYGLGVCSFKVALSTALAMN